MTNRTTKLTRVKALVPVEALEYLMNRFGDYRMSSVVRRCLMEVYHTELRKEPTTYER